MDVTAETFRHLLELSAPLRQKLETKGSHVSYSAYGYHGTEVLTQGAYKWQTYTPYFQGWAKMALENISAQSRGKRIGIIGPSHAGKSSLLALLAGIAGKMIPASVWIECRMRSSNEPIPRSLYFLGISIVICGWIGTAYFLYCWLFL